eukprot:CAMPEP_0119156122 /NCGR_PEP_ID=MMETSP1310-20130426/52097_1 /TAXON_ID=464262 /ORGANISM="Genus nov. species nov., Strain RCC2339" /LENGTH=101 /DNA_ID=CAMNT_0007148731 /DNA_START=132 /DNA_END=437 /DNA_ORIENTATION=-
MAPPQSVRRIVGNGVATLFFWSYLADVSRKALGGDDFVTFASSGVLSGMLLAVLQPVRRPGLLRRAYPAVCGSMMGVVSTLRLMPWGDDLTDIDLISDLSS